MKIRHTKSLYHAYFVFLKKMEVRKLFLFTFQWKECGVHGHVMGYVRKRAEVVYKNVRACVIASTKTQTFHSHNLHVVDHKVKRDRVMSRSAQYEMVSTQQ